MIYRLRYRRVVNRDTGKAVIFDVDYEADSAQHAVDQFRAGFDNSWQDAPEVVDVFKMERCSQLSWT